MGMRRSTRDSLFYVDGDTFHGIMLGWDFTADHEWGTSGIDRAFGLETDENVLGIKRRVINKVPKNLYAFRNTIKRNVYHHLVLGNMYGPDAQDMYELPDCYGEVEDFHIAWCADRFSISVKGADNPNVKHLKDIYSAILNNDACLVWTKPKESGGWGRTCPSILITSRLTREFVQDIYDYDYNQFKLKKAKEDTGIEKFLQDNGLNYSSLIPEWTETGIKETSDGRKIKTNYPVIFKISPRNYQDNNSGWFTVEDLHLWAKGVGPIPKDKESNSKDWILA